MHTPTSVGNASDPSREADAPLKKGNPEPPYLAELFGPESDSRPLPPPVNDLVGEIVELTSAHPAAVAAVALATLVAAIGPRVKLRSGRHCHTLGFNVIVSHQAPRTLPWFDAVVAPFVGHVYDMQLAFCQEGRRKMSEAIERQREEFDQVSKSLATNKDLVARLRAELDRAPAGLRPNSASSSVVPKDLARMLGDCFDGGMTLVGLGNDPGADLLRLKVPERAQLIEALNRSWDGAPLVLAHSLHEAHLSLLWQTREPVEAFLGKRGLQPDCLSVPSLFFSDTGANERIGTFSCEAGWKKLCLEIFNIRCLNRPSSFTVCVEAEALLADFGKTIFMGLSSVPARLRGMVEWLPDLASRLAVLFWILSARAETAVEKVAVAEAIRATKWLGRSHLLAAAAATTLADTADNADKKPMLLTKIRSKGPISRRELRRTFDNQKVRWFDEALDALIEEKKVCYDDSARLVSCH